MQLTSYMMEKRSLSTENTGMDVTRMQIQKSLVLNPDLSSQLFRVSAVATWSTSSIKLSIYSVNDQGVKTADHATCTVNISPSKTWTNEWKRNAYLIQSRIEALRKSVEHGEAHRMKRAIVYRLFANIVEYDPDYQGMREVILNSEDLEAVSTVKFAVDGQGFYFNPKWMDSLGGVAGFIMNGNDSPHPKAEVFINHGWDGFKCTSKFEPGKTYHSYNRMQLREGTLYAGDTYIFDGDEIVAVIQQIQVCQASLHVGRLLTVLVPGGSTSSSGWPEAHLQVKSESSTSTEEHGTGSPNSKAGGKEAPLYRHGPSGRPVSLWWGLVGDARHYFRRGRRWYRRPKARHRVCGTRPRLPLVSHHHWTYTRRAGSGPCFHSLCGMFLGARPSAAARGRCCAVLHHDRLER